MLIISIGNKQNKKQYCNSNNLYKWYILVNENGDKVAKQWTNTTKAFNMCCNQNKQNKSEQLTIPENKKKDRETLFLIYWEYKIEENGDWDVGI